MKKAAFVLSLTVVLVMGLAGSAYASSGDSGYLAPDGSPHGGYTTSSKKCAVCHAVHHNQMAVTQGSAGGNGEVLMRDTVANACVYCHITTTTGLVQVYNGVAANYNGSTDLKNAHSATAGATCVGCHTPHGATSQMANNAYLRTKILKGTNTVDATGTSLSIGVGDANEVAVSKWCTNCHTYYETSHDKGSQTSHFMGVASTDYKTAGGAGTYPSQVAWTGSDTCRSCHADGVTDFVGTHAANAQALLASSFPHFTTGQRFLTAANESTGATMSATDSSEDGVCIRCHVSGSAGVGKSF